MKIPPSHNSYQLKTALTLDQVNDILSLSTLKRYSLFMERTSKDFIGFIEENRFKLIDSRFPLGSACIMAGEIKEGEHTEIELNTSLHYGFKGLFWFWVIVLVGFIIWHLMITQAKDILNFPYVPLILSALFFRLMLHGVYGFARNDALSKIENILNLTRI